MLIFKEMFVLFYCFNCDTMYYFSHLKERKSLEELHVTIEWYPQGWPRKLKHV